MSETLSAGIVNTWLPLCRVLSVTELAESVDTLMWLGTRGLAMRRSLALRWGEPASWRCSLPLPVVAFPG